MKVGDIVRIRKDCEKHWNPELHSKPMKIMRIDREYVRLSCDTFQNGTEFNREKNNLEIICQSRSIVEILNSK
jgi:hypothetical protein